MNIECNCLLSVLDLANVKFDVDLPSTESAMDEFDYRYGVKNLN